MEFIANLWPILMVVLGLGFVIFIHELGHFAVAKWAGVKVEKFSIGFGPSLVGFQRGETYYSLSIIPLGGFVKMLGENPAEDGQDAIIDPRSYLNKPVGHRMAIISAGVIMNIITGLGFFAMAYRLGVPFMPAVVGFVVAGGPAYESGIRPGDEITAIDSKTGVTFEDFLRTVSTSAEGQSVRMDMKRAEDGSAYDVLLTPTIRAGRLKPEVGLGFPQDILLGKPAISKMPGTPATAELPKDLKDRDKIVAVASAKGEWTPVDSNQKLRVELEKVRSEPARLRVVASEEVNAAPREVLVPAVHAMGLGLKFKAGAVTSIQKNSPAALAGIQQGETVSTVDGKPVDPRTFSAIAFDNAGKALKLGVLDASGKSRDVTITPRLEPAAFGPLGLEENQDIPALGLTIFATPVIAEVEPGSAAAAAGLVAGQVVTKIHLITATEESADGKPSTKKPEEMSYQIASAPATDKAQTSGTPLATIATVLRQLDMVKVREVAVSVAANDKETVVKLAPVPATGQFLVDRGFGQLNLIRPLPPQSMGASISRGISETKRSIGEIFGTIRALATQRVSRKLLGGPVTIASQAYASASEGMGLFLKFLGILSINLAVMNFLPIAPLDGGQMVFLIGEKIRGKPLPESFLALFSYMGLIVVLSLMVMVLYQDILRVFGLL